MASEQGFCSVEEMQESAPHLSPPQHQSRYPFEVYNIRDKVTPLHPLVWTALRWLGKGMKSIIEEALPGVPSWLRQSLSNPERKVGCAEASYLQWPPLRRREKVGWKWVYAADF